MIKEAEITEVAQALMLPRNPSSKNYAGHQYHVWKQITEHLFKPCYFATIKLKLHIFPCTVCTSLQ